MQAYLCIYLNGFNVGKIVVTGLTEDQAMDNAVEFVGNKSDIVALKLIGNYFQG